MYNAVGFEKAIIGVSISTEAPVIVYDYEKCIKILMKWEGIEDEDEALDYFFVNVVGTNLKEKTPIFIRKHSTLKDIEDYDYDDEE
tara:strand:- start:214 stop:471 length:258 start_codon:yes stop_codon:yes gene_type:complete